jgi:hypothetical protein
MASLEALRYSLWNPRKFPWYLHDMPPFLAWPGENALEFDLATGEAAFRQIGKQIRSFSPGRAGNGAGMKGEDQGTPRFFNDNIWS